MRLVAPALDGSRRRSRPHREAPVRMPMPLRCTERPATSTLPRITSARPSISIPSSARRWSASPRSPSFVEHDRTPSTGTPRPSDSTPQTSSRTSAWVSCFSKRETLAGQKRSTTPASPASPTSRFSSWALRLHLPCKATAPVRTTSLRAPKRTRLCHRTLPGGPRYFGERSRAPNAPSSGARASRRRRAAPRRGPRSARPPRGSRRRSPRPAGWGARGPGGCPSSFPTPRAARC